MFLSVFTLIIALANLVWHLGTEGYAQTNEDRPLFINSDSQN